MRVFRLLLPTLWAAVAGGAPVLSAQVEGGGAAPLLPASGVQGAAASRWRLDQLTGGAPAQGFLLRSTSSLWAASEADAAAGLVVLPPRVHTGWNSALPYGFNQDGLWPGRGWSAQLRGGGRIGVGRLRLVVAPQLEVHQNRGFQTIPAQHQELSRFASPWRSTSSIDLPQRFGDRSYLTWGWGESSLGVDAGAVTVGVATEQQWWGPGSRNALVLSSNARGFPHAFVRTSRPVTGRWGSLEARWVLGALTESPYFDSATDNDHRSFNGVAVTFTPSAEPGLSLGVARAIYATLPEARQLSAHALDVLRVGNARRDAQDPARAWDQVSSLFFRWLLPESGFETYGELARTRLPGSVRELLLRPNHTMGYTLGLQWAREVGEGGRVWVNPEATHLEQSGDFTQAPTSVFYRSEVVPQGYTHGGRVLGAGMGPGSSQWVELGYGRRTWEVGAFAGRIRWDNDLYYTSFVPRLHQIGFVSHDVSTLKGVRATAVSSWGSVEAEFTDALRLDYLFQNSSLGFNTTDAVDIRNRTLRLTVTPAPLLMRERRRSASGR